MTVVFNMTDAATLLRKRGLEPNGRVQKVFTNQCVRFMNPYVPVRAHVLRELITVRSDSVTYEQPYARFQYFGKLMVSSITGSAYAMHGEEKIPTNIDLVYHGGGIVGPFWDKRMWADRKHEVLRAVAREAGGTAK